MVCLVPQWQSEIWTLLVLAAGKVKLSEELISVTRAGTMSRSWPLSAGLIIEVTARQLLLESSPETKALKFGIDNRSLLYTFS